VSTASLAADCPRGSSAVAFWCVCAALAALVQGGLDAASSALDWRRNGQPGFSGLDLAALVPAVVLLLAFRALARSTGNQSLLRSSLCYLGSGCLLDVIRVIPTDALSETVEVIVALAGVILALARLGFGIWFGVVLLRLRGLGGLLGGIILLRTALWLLFKVLIAFELVQTLSAHTDDDLVQFLVNGSTIDTLDQIRALLGIVAMDLVVFLFFLSERDRLTAPVTRKRWIKAQGIAFYLPEHDRLTASEQP
jgi:hypothetical protein